jgi:fructose-1,6-bisphosphatase II
MYMQKIAVGPEAAGTIDINDSVEANLTRIAAAKRRQVPDLSVVILDRPRHDALVDEIRAAGARIRFIPDGDVAGALMTAMEGTGIDVLLGTGGAPEAVVAACALKCIGGDMQCKLAPRNDEEWAAVKARAIDVDAVLTCDDLVKGDDAFFAATGITDGELLRGVRFFGDGASTQSLVMRSRSGTVRKVDAVHRLNKLRQYAAFPFD